jgi:aryl-alcohol dehydrogenase-like predicted oxidoreductase
MIKGKATVDVTKEFSSKYPDLIYKTFGRTGFTVSAFGFGSYRVDYRVPEHFTAMEYAVTSGINLIDTSANYSDGGSEILTGNVLTELINSGKLKREEIVIVSKGGYIQGKNYAHAKKLKDEGKGYKEVTEYAENLWHSINPEFIKDQVAASLDKMKLETIDVYLLHNPEYFLDSPLAKDLNLEELRHEYYRRIKNAFEQLEAEALAGRISYYGISSNSFGKPADEQIFTSLTECNKIARQLGENNRFAVVQFPFNLFESGPAKELNQFAETMTLIDYAKKHSYGTMVNRPLNAMTPEGLKRLADFDVNPENTSLEEAQIISEINLLDSMEEDFLKEYVPVLDLNAEIKENITAFLKGGLLFKENWKNFGSIENYNDIKKRFLIPRVGSAINTIKYTPNFTPEMQAKLDKIARQVNKLTGIIESIYGLMANINSKPIHEYLNEEIDDESFSVLPLSQKALGMLISLNKIDCVLVGMRQNKYVDDVIETMKNPKIEGAEEIWKELELK